jgi:hypothetical protein
MLRIPDCASNGVGELLAIVYGNTPAVVKVRHGSTGGGWQGEEGGSGRYWDRTSGLFGVNEALSR